jgi:2-dehydropantoate 2-reductase
MRRTDSRSVAAKAQPVRYILYGAGAIGGTLGAQLFELGRDVVLIARGDHGRAIAAGGLRFGTPAGWRTLRIPVVEHPGRLAFQADDVVVLSMKSQDTTNALEALAPLAGPDIAIVCAQNGVENERRALRRFANVHGMCVMMAGVYLEPGIVHMHNAPFGASCDLGRVPHGYDEVDTAFAADLEATGIRSRPTGEILARKYAKLISNLTNVLEAASGRAVAMGELGERARAEAVAVFAAAGIVAERGQTDPRTAMKFADVEGVERPGGSTTQSVARGATSLEVDDLNGEIVLLGRLHGIATPVNLMLQQIGLRLVAEKLPPGSIPVADLERAVARSEA